eukprot:4699242-Amphidinium_carterae.1
MRDKNGHDMSTELTRLRHDHPHTRLRHERRNPRTGADPRTEHPRAALNGTFRTAPTLGV